MPPIRFQFWSPFGVPFWGSFWEPILSIFFCCWLLNIVVLGFRSLGCQAFGKSNLFKSKMVFAQVVRRKGRRISVELFHSQWLQACFVLPSLAATKGVRRCGPRFLAVFGSQFGASKTTCWENFHSDIRVNFFAAACSTRTCQPS